jgi:hypothetical protein
MAVPKTAFTAVRHQMTHAVIPIRAAASKFVAAGDGAVRRGVASVIWTTIKSGVANGHHPGDGRIGQVAACVQPRCLGDEFLRTNSPRRSRTRTRRRSRYR